MLGGIRTRHRKAPFHGARQTWVKRVLRQPSFAKWPSSRMAGARSLEHAVQASMDGLGAAFAVSG